METRSVLLADIICVSKDNIKLQEPCVLYIGRAYWYPPDVAFYIFFFQQI